MLNLNFWVLFQCLTTLIFIKVFVLFDKVSIELRFINIPFKMRSQ